MDNELNALDGLLKCPFELFECQNGCLDEILKLSNLGFFVTIEIEPLDHSKVIGLYYEINTKWSFQ